MWRALFFIFLFAQTSADTDSETVGEKIFRKIASGLKESVIKVRTCGVPTIKNVMRNLTLNPGDRALFRCKVDMKCMVSYIQWYHEMRNGSVRLLRTGATAGTPYSYMINKVDISDSGFYSCVAGNILGESVSSAYLDINTSTSSLTAGQATWLGLMAMSLLLHYSHHISLTTTRGLQTSQHLRTL